MGDRPRITEETLRVLAAIAYMGEATPAQVRTRTGLASGTVSPILARLEAVGWLQQRREAKGPATAGRPLRSFYGVRDQSSVREMARSMLTLVGQLSEDLG